MSLDDFGMMVFRMIFWMIFEWYIIYIYIGWCSDELMLFWSSSGFFADFASHHDVCFTTNGFGWSLGPCHRDHFAWLPMPYLKQAMGHPNGTTINWPFFLDVNHREYCTVWPNLCLRVSPWLGLRLPLACLFIFPYIGKFIIPTDELHRLSEG